MNLKLKRDPIPNFFLTFSSLFFLVFVLIIVGSQRFFPRMAEVFTTQTGCVYPPCPPSTKQPPATQKPTNSPTSNISTKSPTPAIPLPTQVPGAPTSTTLAPCKTPTIPTQSFQAIELTKPSTWFLNIWGRLIGFLKGKVPAIFEAANCPAGTNYGSGSDIAPPVVPPVAAPPPTGPPVTAGTGDPCSRHTGNNYQNCIQAVALAPQVTIACADDSSKVCGIDWEKAYWSGAPIDDKNQTNGNVDERTAWQQDNRQRYQDYYVKNGSDPCGSYGGDKDDCQAFALTALAKGIPLHEAAVIKDGQITQILEGNIIRVGEESLSVSQLLDRNYRQAKQTNLEAQRAAVFEQVLKNAGYDNRYLYQAIANAASQGKDFLTPLCPNPSFCSPEAIGPVALSQISAFSDLKLPTPAAAVIAQTPTAPVKPQLPQRTIYSIETNKDGSLYITVNGSQLPVTKCKGTKFVCVDGFQLTDLTFDEARQLGIEHNELVGALVVRPTTTYVGSTLQSQINYEGQNYVIAPTNTGGACLQRGSLCLTIPNYSYSQASQQIDRHTLEYTLLNGLVPVQKVLGTANILKITQGADSYYFTPNGIYINSLNNNDYLGALPLGTDIPQILEKGIPYSWVKGLSAAQAQIRQASPKVTYETTSLERGLYRLNVDLPIAQQGRNQQVWFTPIRDAFGNVTSYTAYTQSNGQTLALGSWKATDFGQIGELVNNGLNPILAQSITAAGQAYVRRLETLLTYTPTSPLVADASGPATCAYNSAGTRVCSNKSIVLAPGARAPTAIKTTVNNYTYQYRDPTTNTTTQYNLYRDEHQGNQLCLHNGRLGVNVCGVDPTPFIYDTDNPVYTQAALAIYDQAALAEKQFKIQAAQSTLETYRYRSNYTLAAAAFGKDPATITMADVQTYINARAEAQKEGRPNDLTDIGWQQFLAGQPVPVDASQRGMAGVICDAGFCYRPGLKDYIHTEYPNLSSEISLDQSWGRGRLSGAQIQPGQDNRFITPNHPEYLNIANQVAMTSTTENIPGGCTSMEAQSNGDVKCSFMEVNTGGIYSTIIDHEAIQAYASQNLPQFRDQQIAEETFQTIKQTYPDFSCNLVSINSCSKQEYDLFSIVYASALENKSGRVQLEQTIKMVAPMIGYLAVGTMTAGTPLAVAVAANLTTDAALIGPMTTTMSDEQLRVYRNLTLALDNQCGPGCANPAFAWIPDPVGVIRLRNHPAKDAAYGLAYVTEAQRNENFETLVSQAVSRVSDQDRQILTQTSQTGDIDALRYGVMLSLLIPDPNSQVPVISLFDNTYTFNWYSMSPSQRQQYFNQHPEFKPQFYNANSTNNWDEFARTQPALANQMVDAFNHQLSAYTVKPEHYTTAQVAAIFNATQALGRYYTQSYQPSNSVTQFLNNPQTGAAQTYTQTYNTNFAMGVVLAGVGDIGGEYVGRLIFDVPGVRKSWSEVAVAGVNWREAQQGGKGVFVDEATQIFLQPPSTATHFDNPVLALLFEPRAHDPENFVLGKQIVKIVKSDGEEVSKEVLQKGVTLLPSDKIFIQTGQQVLEVTSDGIYGIVNNDVRQTAKEVMDQLSLTTRYIAPTPTRITREVEEALTQPRVILSEAPAQTLDRVFAEGGLPRAFEQLNRGENQITLRTTDGQTFTLGPGYRLADAHGTPLPLDQRPNFTRGVEVIDRDGRPVFRVTGRPTQAEVTVTPLATGQVTAHDVTQVAAAMGDEQAFREVAQETGALQPRQLTQREQDLLAASERYVAADEALARAERIADPNVPLEPLRTVHQQAQDELDVARNRLGRNNPVVQANDTLISAQERRNHLPISASATENLDATDRILDARAQLARTMTEAQPTPPLAQIIDRIRLGAERAGFLDADGHLQLPLGRQATTTQALSAKEAYETIVSGKNLAEITEITDNRIQVAIAAQTRIPLSEEETTGLTTQVRQLINRDIADRSQTKTLGRLGDIRTPSYANTVSRNHLEVVYDKQTGKVFIKDTGSTGGTRIAGGEVIEKGKLFEVKNGDLITLGTYDVQVEITPGGYRFVSAAGGQPLAQVHIWTPAVEWTQREFEIVVDDTRRVYYTVTEPFREPTPAYRIGRDISNGMVVDDTFVAVDSVSREHAQILTKGESTFIRDLDSQNGTFIGRNGVRTRIYANENVLLEEGDIIYLGSNSPQFRFSGGKLVKLTPDESATLAKKVTPSLSILEATGQDLGLFDPATDRWRLPGWLAGQPEEIVVPVAPVGPITGNTQEILVTLADGQIVRVRGEGGVSFLLYLPFDSGEPTILKLTYSYKSPQDFQEAVQQALKQYQRAVEEGTAQGRKAVILGADKTRLQLYIDARDPSGKTVPVVRMTQLDRVPTTNQVLSKVPRKSVSAPGLAPAMGGSSDIARNVGEALRGMGKSDPEISAMNQAVTSAYIGADARLTTSPRSWQHLLNSIPPRDELTVGVNALRNLTLSEQAAVMEALRNAIPSRPTIPQRFIGWFTDQAQALLSHFQPKPQPKLIAQEVSSDTKLVFSNSITQADRGILADAIQGQKAVEIILDDKGQVVAFTVDQTMADGRRQTLTYGQQVDLMSARAASYAQQYKTNLNAFNLTGPPNTQLTKNILSPILSKLERHDTNIILANGGLENYQRLVQLTRQALVEAEAPAEVIDAMLLDLRTTKTIVSLKTLGQEGEYQKLVKAFGQQEVDRFIAADRDSFLRDYYLQLAKANKPLEELTNVADIERGIQVLTGEVDETSLEQARTSLANLQSLAGRLEELAANDPELETQLPKVRELLQTDVNRTQKIIDEWPTVVRPAHVSVDACPGMFIIQGYEAFDKPSLNLWDKFLIILQNIWNLVWQKPRPAEIFNSNPCLSSTTSTIGRASSDFTIQDGQASRQHAMVTSETDSRLAIEDLGSTNGTLVNGKPVKERVYLADGDTITIGQTKLTVKDTPKGKIIYDFTHATSYNPQTRSVQKLRIYLIGRGDPAAGIKPEIVLDLPRVSRSHARLLIDQDTGVIFLEDLGSSNGTLINGRRLTPHQPTAVKVGDTFSFADQAKTQLQSSKAGTYRLVETETQRPIGPALQSKSQTLKLTVSSAPVIEEKITLTDGTVLTVRAIHPQDLPVVLKQQMPDLVDFLTNSLDSSLGKARYFAILGPQGELLDIKLVEYSVVPPSLSQVVGFVPGYGPPSSLDFLSQAIKDLSGADESVTQLLRANEVVINKSIERTTPLAFQSIPQPAAFSDRVSQAYQALRQRLGGSGDEIVINTSAGQEVVIPPMGIIRIEGRPDVSYVSPEKVAETLNSLAKRLPGEQRTLRLTFIAPGQTTGVEVEFTLTRNAGGQPKFSAGRMPLFSQVGCAQVPAMSVIEGYQEFNKPIFTLWDQIRIILKNIWNFVWQKPRPAEIFNFNICVPK